jgi:hypothetical protein
MAMPEATKCQLRRVNAENHTHLSAGRLDILGNLLDAIGATSNDSYTISVFCEEATVRKLL